MDFQGLVEKALSDEKFAQSMLNKPEETLRGVGVEPTPEILAALKGVDAESLKRLAAAFGDHKAAT